MEVVDVVVVDVVVSGTVVVVDVVVSGTVVVVVVVSGTVVVVVPLQNPAPVAGTPMASTTSITLSFSGVPSPKRNRPLELSTHTYVTVRLGMATDVVAGS